VVKVTGIDDGYFPLRFKGGKGHAPLVSVIYENYNIVNVDYTLILVDGNDASNKLKLLNKEGYLILDGVVFGGFNYVEPESDWIIFYSKRPNVEEIERALRKHFSNDATKVSTILNVIKNLTPISTRKGTVYVYTSLDFSEVSQIISYYQVFGKRPEPLRAAHIIASAIGKFLYG